VGKRNHGTDNEVADDNIANAQNVKQAIHLWSPLFEIALVLVRLDHIAGRIVHANHSIM
jgi:hypothetical protein